MSEEGSSQHIKSEDSSPQPIKFKSRKKNLRTRKDSSEEEDSEEEMEALKKLEEMKSLQKLRQRPNGVSIISLTVGEKVAEEDELLVKDPFKIKSGGLVNMSALKSGQVKKVDDAYDTGIGTQFSAETNKRDEDEEM
ncbi:telomere length and silencing protein 1 homolog [Diaphorina citri]|nr:telomere length and silencing protein 1 homolog [Diaphorina citri]XP_008477913.1 telomere length and silencing protein 1 homolog [Diaphorina citri]